MEFVNRFDEALTYAVDNDLFPDMVVRVAKPEEIAPHHDAIVSEITALLPRSDVSLVAPLYGTVPLLQDVWAHTTPDGRSRIYPIIASATNGTDFRKTISVHGKLPKPQPARREPDGYLPTVIIAEDVVDGNHVLAGLIAKLTGEDIANAESMVAACERHNIVIAVQVSKNDEVLTALQKAVAPATTRWQKMQKCFVDQIVSKPMVWLMGEGMDTGIKVQDILDRLDPNIIQHPAVALLFSDAVRDSEFRIGSTIDGLIGLTGPYHQLIDCVVGSLRYFLTERITHWEATHRQN